jgi:hypothetical protein
MLASVKFVSDNAARGFAKGWPIERQLVKVLWHLGVLGLLSPQKTRVRPSEGMRYRPGDAMYVPSFNRLRPPYCSSASW